MRSTLQYERCFILGPVPPWGHSQRCIRTADNRRKGGGGSPNPPSLDPFPLDPDLLVGNDDIYKRKYGFALFLVHKLC